MQGIPALERIRAILAPAITDRLRGTLRDRVEGVWLALGGPACVESLTDLEDAEVYLDALEELEEAGEVDFARLAELLEELYAQMRAAMAALEFERAAKLRDAMREAAKKVKGELPAELKAVIDKLEQAPAAPQEKKARRRKRSVRGEPGA